MTSPEPSNIQYYIMDSDGHEYGPVDSEGLQTWISQGRVNVQTQVRHDGESHWQPAIAMADIQPMLEPPVAPPIEPPVSPPPYSGQQQPHATVPEKLGDDAGMRMLLPVGRSGWAIAAGYVGLFALIIIPAPLALLLGVIAIVDIKKNPDKHGMGRSIFAVVMGALGSIVLIAMMFD